MDILTRNDGGPGVEIIGLDITSATHEEAVAIRNAVYAHHVVAIRAQPRLTEDSYLTFARLLGTLLTYPIDSYHHPEHHELYVSSNVRMPDGRRFGVAKTGDYWHSDLSFAAAPVSFTMLYMPLLPESRRETQFVDMVAAYGDLAEPLRQRLSHCIAIHNANGRYKIRESDIGKSMREIEREVNAQCPEVRHPCVIQHPITREKAIYINEGFTVGLEGDEQGEILREVFAFLGHPDRIRRHVWGANDVVLWDNRTVNHRSGGVSDGSPYVVYRASMFDGLNFY